MIKNLDLSDTLIDRRRLPLCLEAVSYLNVIFRAINRCDSLKTDVFVEILRQHPNVCSNIRVIKAIESNLPADRLPLKWNREEIAPRFYIIIQAVRLDETNFNEPIIISNLILYLGTIMPVGSFPNFRILFR